MWQVQGEKTMTTQEHDTLGQGGADELLILATSTGRSFMQFFVETLADCFGADIVSIGELMVMEDDRFNVLAGYMNGAAITDFSYQSCVTPCCNVVNTSQPQVILSGAQAAYPDDEIFIEQQIQSYVAMPLESPEGEAVGVIQASWRRELDQEEADNVIEIMSMFVSRLSAELVTLHAMRILSALAEGPDRTDNLGTLSLLCEQMQTALKVRAAFIAERISDDESHFRVLAFCQDGKPLTESEGQKIAYHIGPCAQLKEQDIVLAHGQMPQMFPNQSHGPGTGAADNLVSYLGMNIRNEAGQVIGHLALQHDRDLMAKSLESDLFKLLSSRVTSELRKYQTEQQAAQIPQAALDMPKQVMNGIHQKLDLMHGRLADLVAQQTDVPDSELQILQAELTEVQKLLG